MVPIMKIIVSKMGGQVNIKKVEKIFFFNYSVKKVYFLLEKLELESLTLFNKV